jgi:hypothetical protein
MGSNNFEHALENWLVFHARVWSDELGGNAVVLANKQCLMAARSRSSLTLASPAAFLPSFGVLSFCNFKPRDRTEFLCGTLCSIVRSRAQFR